MATGNNSKVAGSYGSARSRQETAATAIAELTSIQREPTARPNYDAEATPAKSLDPEAALNEAPALSSSFNSTDRPNISADERPHSASDLGINSRDNLLDISLKSKRSDRQNDPERSTEATVESAFQQLALNIPVSLDTDVGAIGIAENQPSFRTVSSFGLNGRSNEKGVHPQCPTDTGDSALFSQTSSSDKNSNRLTSLSSIEDNTFNISLTSNVCDSQRRHPIIPPNHQQANHIPVYGGAAAAPSQGPPSSTISMRSEIPNDCLVRKLPRKMIQLVASHLQCKLMHGTWKDLVELHDWNYDRTFIFEHQPHPEGIFFSLLRENEFQNYTLDELRRDLFNIPRKDILHDLNEMIQQHNEGAANQVHRLSSRT
ncbi:uncharacterized protein LOC131947519 isoform X2 [Physella acuta]|uniref:uncharacterized protein LOC131947519 isoform X2 n=1 Tax=Physella acuta TaxID=109671 RepID=UPI0027DDFA21|nr:uncharacterized protein LOC131947519 isoform X2 [Physella acuta]XP_059164735.1 uncharacterized protein LOC131947519 isoform X2 [Physella acuta]